MVMRSVCAITMPIIMAHAMSSSTSSCSTEQKKALSDELMKLVNAKISQNVEDVQYLQLITGGWKSTKTELASALPNMNDADMDTCRMENMSHFLELFAKRKIALTPYPQKLLPAEVDAAKAQGGAPASLAQVGRQRSSPLKRTLRPAALAQTQSRMNLGSTKQTQKMLESVPDFSKEMMKRHNQQGAMMQGLQATMVGMGPVAGGMGAGSMMPSAASLDDAPVNDMNSTLMDEKITNLLQMNQSDINLSGELSSIVSDLAANLDKDEGPQKPHEKTDTEKLLEKLESDEDVSDDVLADAMSLVNTNAGQFMNGAAAAGGGGGFSLFQSGNDDNAGASMMNPMFRGSNPLLSGMDAPFGGSPNVATLQPEN